MINKAKYWRQCMYSLAFKMEILRELNSEVIGCYTRYLLKNRDKDNSEIEKNVNVYMKLIG